MTTLNTRKRERVGPICIDGSSGEGGGQILRNAISLANILQIPISIENIRGKRSQPGLKEQHVKSIQVATTVCGGSLTGDAVGSTTISFVPSQQGEQEDYPERVIKGNIKTAGSICLLLQAALPCALFGIHHPCRLILSGGTNATLAPQYDYWERVFWPTLQRVCNLKDSQVEAQVIRRGYFPKGGGEVQLRVEPLKHKLPAIRLTDRGDVTNIHIRSFHAGNLPRHLAVNMANAATKILTGKNFRKSMIKTEIVTEQNAIGSALGILIVAETTTGCLFAGSALSTPQKKAAEVGIEAANELWTTLEDGGCVDEWLQDQLILLMALAEGTSEIITGSLTLHTQTAIRIAEEICGVAFHVEKLSSSRIQSVSTVDSVYGQDGRVPGRHKIRCTGLGFLLPKADAIDVQVP